MLRSANLSALRQTWKDWSTALPGSTHSRRCQVEWLHDLIESLISFLATLKNSQPELTDELLLKHLIRNARLGQVSTISRVPSEIMANVPILSPNEYIDVPCVIPESEIQAFIGALRMRESQVVLARLLIAVFAAIELMHSRVAGKPDETKLLLIKELAREDKNKRYRHMMDEMVSALGSHKEGDEWMKGFGSVCMTIGRAFEYASKSLPDYSAVRLSFEQGLEQTRQACGV